MSNRRKEDAPPIAPQKTPSRTPTHLKDGSLGHRLKRPLTILLMLVTVIIAGAFGIWFLSRPGKPPIRKFIADARRHLRDKEYDLAEKAAIQATSDPELASEAWMVAAKSATQANRPKVAIEYYDHAIGLKSAMVPEALKAAGELSFRTHQLRRAQGYFEKLLEVTPNDLEPRQRYIYMLGLTGRLWETLPHLRKLLERDKFDQNILLFLGDYERVVDFSIPLQPIRENNPDDSQLMLGLARIALANQRSEEAEKLLRQCIAKEHASSEAHVRIGQIILERQDWAALSEWKQTLPTIAYQHPQLWVVLGQWSREKNQVTMARTCFAKALQLDPNHRQALFQMSELLRGTGENEIASELQQRQQKLEAFIRLLATMYGKQPRPDWMAQAAEMCESLGRLSEARGWNLLVLQSRGAASRPQTQQAEENLRRLDSAMPKEKDSWVAENSRPARLLVADLSKSLDWSNLDQKLSIASTAPPNESTNKDLGIQWKDVASEVALRFDYFSSPTPGSEGKRLFEFGGGGVGASDFDLDGWPDLILTQGCQWPPPGWNEVPLNVSRVPQSQEAFHHVVFRNRNGERFEDISIQAGIVASSFGQGIACGDFDCDGFQDIYIANIGQNLLYQNNGDGTFSEVGSGFNMVSKRWTTSCAIADVTGDGLPDIYDVNYLGGKDLFDRVCEWEGGRKRICGPGTFEAEHDVLWVNTGEGFIDASKQSKIELPNGKGLGIVVGDLDGSGRNSLFIANDQTENFFFVPEESSHHQTSGSTFRIEPFSDEAVIRGLAYDENGSKQGCMGVAVGDFNHDHQVDLFVTNYVTESNTLYEQIHDGQYSDRTRRANLREASIAMVGFGTQGVDARLIGSLDLVVTNGHLDDFKFKQQAYEMPTQFFRNNGSGGFGEITALLDGYFQGKHRGRGMAKLDWNRDGREDLAITHLDSPAALLENRTKQVGNHIVIQLVGTECSRDAIGATVRIECGNDAWTQFLVAGDGYQASNQRELVFGLGSHTVVDHLSVRWPGGKKEVFHGLEISRKWIVVEGCGIN